MRSMPTSTEATEARTWVWEAGAEAGAAAEAAREGASVMEVGEECSEAAEEAEDRQCRGALEAEEGAGVALVMEVPSGAPAETLVTLEAVT